MFSKHESSHEVDLEKMFEGITFDDEKMHSAQTIRVNCQGPVRTVQFIFENGYLVEFEGEMGKEKLKKIENVNDKGERVTRFYENNNIVKVEYPDIVLIYSVVEKNKLIRAYEKKGVGCVTFS